MQDLLGISGFLERCRQAVPSGDYEHAGDIFWAMRRPDFNPERNIVLLVDDAAIAGFCINDEGFITFRSSPGQDPSLYEELLRWCEHTAWRGEGVVSLATQAGERNTSRIELLEEQGYGRRPSYFNVLEQSTDPPGRRMRTSGRFRVLGRASGGGDQRVREGARGSRGEGSTYTRHVHLNVERLPGHLRELNPVIVANDGTIAGSCMCWLDRTNCVGEIEPVQISPHFRRRGLARALISEALKRMGSHGMRSALVYSASVNNAAIGLYASAGFKPRGWILVYGKELGSH